jgi:hypothetical protein
MIFFLRAREATEFTDLGIMGVFLTAALVLYQSFRPKSG